MEGNFKVASPVTVRAGHSVWEDPQERSLNFPAHPDSLADSARWPKERLPWLSRPSGTPNCPRSIPIWLRSIRLSHQMSEPPAFRRVPLCSRLHWFQRPRTTPGRGITPGLLTTQTCGTSRQPRIQTGWPLAKTFWIKIVSSRCHSLQAGTISSSATTRFGRFRQPCGDWGSIPVRPMEFLDLTLDARSKTTR